MRKQLLHHLQASVPNVDGCVMVPVMESPTTGASPLSIGKGESLVQRTAYMAHFAGWEPLIDFDKDFSAIPEFIFQHVAEHPKTVIVGGLAKLQRASHIAQVDVFHEDSVVPLGYRGTQLLAEVFCADWLPSHGEVGPYVFAFRSSWTHTSYGTVFAVPL